MKVAEMVPLRNGEIAPFNTVIAVETHMKDMSSNQEIFKEVFREVASAKESGSDVLCLTKRTATALANRELADIKESGDRTHVALREHVFDILDSMTAYSGNRMEILRSSIADGEGK